VFEGDGKVKDFHSNYSAYRLQKMKEEQLVKREIQESKEKREKPKSEFIKATYKQVKEFEQLTDEIETLEKEKSQIEALLSSGSTDADLLHKSSLRYGEIQSILEEKEFRWLELSELMP
jgi:ATP-binding cassette subfamily F protein uup